MLSDSETTELYRTSGSSTAKLYGVKRRVEEVQWEDIGGDGGSKFIGVGTVKNGRSPCCW